MALAWRTCSLSLLRMQILRSPNFWVQPSNLFNFKDLSHSLQGLRLTFGTWKTSARRSLSRNWQLNKSAVHWMCAHNEQRLAHARHLFCLLPPGPSNSPSVASCASCSAFVGRNTSHVQNWPLRHLPVVPWHVNKRMMDSIMRDNNSWFSAARAPKKGFTWRVLCIGTRIQQFPQNDSRMLQCHGIFLPQWTPGYLP